MIPVNQRWHDRRDTYRPAGEPIATRLYEVAPIDGDSTARAFVERHHYSASYPAARWRFGLYRLDRLVGVAVFSHPSNDRVLTNTFAGTRATDGVELGRFVLLDDVPGNGETWFLGRCFDLLRREDLVGVVSFSDPMPRATASGLSVMPGHVGTIYQAHNGVYLGRATPRTLKLLPDGTVLSDRAIQKIRAGERGWRPAAELLVRHGADAPCDDRRAWLRRWLSPGAGLVRRVRHLGNYRYAWTLQRRHRGMLPTSLAYPKLLGTVELIAS
jgi:hypothetical protein